MRFTIFILFFYISVTSSASQKTDTLLKNYFSNNFLNIDWAGYEFIKLEQDSIILPLFINMLQDTLQINILYDNCALYPGMLGLNNEIPRTCIVYNLNYTYLRAAWLIEQITFESFGYKQFTKYENNTHYISDFKNNWIPRTEVNDSIYRDTAFINATYNKVRVWWNENHKTWNRNIAFLKALKSDKNDKIEQALQYLSAYLHYKEKKAFAMETREYKIELYSELVKLKLSKPNELKSIEYCIYLLKFYKII